METYDRLVEKWNPVLAEESAGSITDSHRKAVTAVLLENTENALREERAQMSFLNEAGPATSVTNASVSNWDPVLISLVRRAAPNMIAYDVAGVQPMTGPTGLIFAMKARYGTGTTGATEALFNEADTTYAGDSSDTQTASPSGLAGIDPAAGNVAGDSSLDSERSLTFGDGTTTALGELSGAFRNMGFTIEKSTVTAKSRALKAEYSLELAQDLKAIHGLDAETELANILSTEILAEINREVIRTINSQAKTGAGQASTAINGIFDMSTDADGRWSVEKFKGLHVQIERDSNVIAKETRRGKGNFIICSSDVASALAAAGSLDYTPALSTNLNVDDTGNTFAGLMNGRTRVYIDPYSTTDYVTVGYKGTNPYDAGIFYCPYVPLTMVRAVGENDFQPKIGFKTRYGMASNPFVGATPANGLAAAKSNQYYRIFRVDNIMA
ncbi:MAG: ATP-binding protein [Cryomorphaceae bacterium]|nr:ATP-binding protein [Cryomorphaceae bacterium]|tara:strand:+ start:1557 stop:2879 length:1323 start_codon:yes stop_codon:yes gene_type:complete